MLFQYSC